jgi:phosphopantetheine--protein transferase-like protein
MDAKAVTEYLGRLLNKPVTSDSVIRLSSAQKPKFHAWLKANNVSVNEGLIGAEFSVESILGTRSAASRIGPVLNKNEERTIVAQSSNTFETARGVGIDIQRISELFPDGLSADLKSDETLTRIFTMRELSYAQSKGSPRETLTGIFAAKEAMQKCCDSGSAIPGLTALEVLPDVVGKPTCKGFVLSISHSGEYAVAIAYKQNGLANIPVDAKADLEPLSSQDGAALAYQKTSWRRDAIRRWDAIILVFIALMVCSQIILLIRAH